MTNPVPEPATEPTAQDGTERITPPTVAELIADAAADPTLPDGVHRSSDTGNARRFAQLYGDVVRFAQDSKMWYVWQGTHWQPDPGGLAVLGLTQGVVRYIREHEANLVDVDAAEALGGFALRTESESSRQKMLKLVPAELRVRLRERDLDADPWLLVVRNGTLDLRTGELRASRPEDLCTRRAAVTFDPAADCPMWRDHVRTVTGDNLVLAAYLRRACGYALTGLVNEQKFWFLWGAGQNGKNVFAETVMGLLGDYGAVAAPGLLTGGTGQHPTILADLRGARMVVADETGHERVNDARLKMLTGSAQVKARFTGKDFFTYDSTMKLWVLGNAKPVIKDQSEGTWRRMQLVPFTVRIPDAKKRANFAEELRAEWSGILNWCLTGLEDWRTLESVGAPEVVTDAVRTYREEEDEIGQWLEECCEPSDEGEFVIFSTLYVSYQMWAARSGLKPQEVLGSTAFGRALTGRVFGDGRISDTDKTRVAGRQVRVRRGLRLASSHAENG